MELTFETDLSELNAHAQPFVPGSTVSAKSNIEQQHQPQFQYQSDPYYGASMGYYYLVPLTPVPSIAPSISQSLYAERAVVPVIPVAPTISYPLQHAVQTQTKPVRKPKRAEQNQKRSKKREVTKQSIRARVDADFIRQHYEALAVAAPPTAYTPVPSSYLDSYR
jgi:hypothetical protein